MRARSWAFLGLAAALLVGCVADDERGPAAAAASGSQVGQTVSDFSMQTLSGKSAKLSDYRGKVVLVDFWAPWCPPCRLGLPFTQRLFSTFGKKNLAVLAVSTDPRKSVQPFIASKRYSMPVFLADDDASVALGVEGLPTTLVIDPAGRLVKRIEGLGPQADLIAALKTAGLDTRGFEPRDDPVLSAPSG